MYVGLVSKQTIGADKHIHESLKDCRRDDLVGPHQQNGRWQPRVYPSQLGNNQNSRAYCLNSRLDEGRSLQF